MLDSDPTPCPEKKKKNQKNQNFAVPIQDKAVKLFQSRGGRQAAAGISLPAPICARAVPAVAPAGLSRRLSRVNVPGGAAAQPTRDKPLSQPRLAGRRGTAGTAQPGRGAQRGSPAPPEQRWLSLLAAPPGPLSWVKEPPNLFPGVLSLSFHFSSAHAFFNQTAGAAVRCPPVLQGHTREFWTLSPPPRSPSRTPGTQQGLSACCPQGQEGRKSFYPKAKKL